MGSDSEGPEKAPRLESGSSQKGAPAATVWNGAITIRRQPAPVLAYDAILPSFVI
jgi:hypothetical protein